MMTAGPLASMVPLWMRLPGTQGEELKRTQSNQRLHVRSYLSLCKFAFSVIWKFHFTESSISCCVRVCVFPFLHERWDNSVTTSILCARACVSAAWFITATHESWKVFFGFQGDFFFFFLLLWRWNESRVRQFKRNKPQSTVVSVCIIVTRGIRLVLSLPLRLRSLNNWQMGSLPFEAGSFWSLRIIKGNSSCVTFRVPLTCAFPTFLKSQ